MEFVNKYLDKDVIKSFDEHITFEKENFFKLLDGVLHLFDMSKNMNMVTINGNYYNFISTSELLEKVCGIREDKMVYLQVRNPKHNLFSINFVNPDASIENDDNRLKFWVNKTIINE